MLLAPFVALLAMADASGPQPAADEPAAPPGSLLPALPETEEATPSPMPSPPPPEVPAPATVEEETPEPPPPPPAPIRVIGSFGIEMGYARGGDRFIAIAGPIKAPGTATGTNAGDGAFFSFAGSWMPYWSERGVGVGVYARAGAKYANVGDSTTDAAFLRFPLAVGAQLLIPVSGRFFVLGRLGVMTEVFERLAVATDGVTQERSDFSPSIGEFLDAGVYLAPSERSGLAAVARVERIDVSYGDVVMNANNVSTLLAAYARF